MPLKGSSWESVYELRLTIAADSISTKANVTRTGKTAFGVCTRGISMTVVAIELRAFVYICTEFSTGRTNTDKRTAKARNGVTDIRV